MSKSLEQIIEVKLGSQVVKFELYAEHQYGQHYRFCVTDFESKGVVLDGGITDSGFYSFLGSQKVSYFVETLESKIKTLLRKVAKDNKLKIKF